MKDNQVIGKDKEVIDLSLDEEAASTSNEGYQTEKLSNCCMVGNFSVVKSLETLFIKILEI